MKQFPALLDLSNNRLHSLGEGTEFLAGRQPKANLVLQDLSCSRAHFRIVLDAGRYFVESLASSNPTYCNGQPVSGRAALAHNTVVQAGNCRFQFLEHDPSRPSRPSSLPPVPAASLPPAPPPLPLPPRPLATPPVLPMPPPPPLVPPVVPPLPSGSPLPLPVPSPSSGSGDWDRTIMATPEQMARQGEVLRERIPVQGHMLIGRERGRVHVHLPHALVSRLHAEITRKGAVATVVDFKSANGTFVNGERVQAPRTIRAGDRIDIGPFSLLYTGDALVPQSRENNIELVGDGLTHSVPDRITGKARLLLDEVSVVVRPHELVCLLGPSGSGKSTLLSALSARAPAFQGTVRLNGKDLYSNFEVLKQDLAVVPQRDLLHDTLTVEQALSYTAKLRLPPDTSADELRAAIDQMLDTVGLTPHRKTPIRSLSGGQLKRASLANELLSKPTLLFLDEVTSGLDEQTDREMMELFRRLADSGKTVLCITHTMANVERNAHLVVILTAGGKLAFVGPPIDAVRYFGVDRLGDVYEKLGQRPAQEWQADFRRSEYFTRYVKDRLPPEEIDEPGPVYAVPRPLTEGLIDFLRQTYLLGHRHVAILRGDILSVLAMMGQSLLVAVLLVMLFGNLEDEKPPDGLPTAPAAPTTLAQQQTFAARQQEYLTARMEAEQKYARHGRYSVMLFFLLQISCFWFGCNNAAKEIVKERGIYARERAANLFISSYYASKFVLLSLMTLMQTALVFGVVWLGSKPPGDGLGVLAFLMTLSVAGVALGLLMSAASKTPDMAVTLIPIALIPQIILADVIRPVGGLSKGLAQVFITSYWANRGLTALLPEEVAEYAGVEQGSARTAFAMLALHALVFVTAALVVLIVQDRMQRQFGPALARLLARMRRPSQRRQR